MMSARPFVLFLAVILGLARHDAHASAGALDPTFGTGGVVVMSESLTGDYFYAATPHAAGGVVAVGEAIPSNASIGLVARYDASGVLDTAFGTDGILHLGAGYLTSALTLADGRVLVAGRGPQDSGLVARITPEGDLDMTFGTAGVTLTALGTRTRWMAMAVQNDGNILTCGYRTDGQNEMALARFTPDGDLDGTFGNGGLVNWTFPMIDDVCNGVALQSDGRIVLVGGSNNDGFLWRYDAQGVLDETFGVDGLVTVPDFGSGMWRGLTTVRIQPDDAILVGGAHMFTDPVVARFTASGAPDATFGTNGRVTLSAYAGDIVQEIVRQPNGRWLVVVAGQMSKLIRLHGNGAFDENFGNNGVLAMTIPNQTSVSFFSAFQQADSRLVTAGFTQTEGVLARYDVSECGDGVREGVEACDDGNLIAGDCCSPTCTFEPAGTTCDDGNVCTTDDVCSSGVCGGSAVMCPSCERCEVGTGCVVGPRDDCRTTTGPAALRLTASRLAWKWLKGDAVSVAELGDPVAVDDYALCVYDHADDAPQLLVRATAPAGGRCKGGACWRRKGKSGFVYTDRDGTPDGLTKMVLKAGKAGRSKVIVNGKSPAAISVDPTFPVRVQVQSRGNVCFDALHSSMSRR